MKDVVIIVNIVSMDVKNHLKSLFVINLNLVHFVNQYNYEKKIILLAVTALMIVGCISDEEEARKYENDGFATLTYDSCEYVFKVSGYKGFLAHKGNCRFCKERKQKELKELVEQLKKNNYGNN